jgi:hypothetical protein
MSSTSMMMILGWDVAEAKADRPRRRKKIRDFIGSR